ncbi:YceI family protein [Labrenzia sp. 011]|uniref:YceI family protein n=1 Tax=Labrenzia sp. 011 TaxID=2171494 RepID=UPI000D508F92|nr:YceI family protein [Labrenzia sp. 011]PVB61085.1 polyisoprenoid-binding protein [Labrenzia sp. 011]
MTSSATVQTVFAKHLASSLRFLVVALSFLAVSVPAHSGPISGTYVLSPAQIDTGFSVRVLGGGPVTGQFKKVSGRMILDQGQPQNSRVRVTIDLASVQTGNDRITGFLKSAAMFDVARFPLADFRSTRVRITGAESAEVEGILTMRGMTKRTRLSVTVTGTGKDGRVGFEVTGGFFRSLYGMEAGMPIYADKVNLKITGTGRRG